MAADGGVFAFDAQFYGSLAGDLPEGETIVGMTATAAGYYLISGSGTAIGFGERATD